MTYYDDMNLYELKRCYSYLQRKKLLKRATESNIMDLDTIKHIIARRQKYESK